MSTDRRHVLVYVSRDEASDLLTDIAESRRVAVGFNVPSTLRSLQLKGTDASVQALGPEDFEALEASIEATSADLARIGYGGAYSHAYFSCPRDRLLAVVFTPSEAFDQTPGPTAGRRVGAAP